VFTENAHGFHVPDGLQNGLGGKVIFGHFVFYIAKPGLPNSQLRQLGGTGCEGLGDGGGENFGVERWQRICGSNLWGGSFFSCDRPNGDGTCKAGKPKQKSEAWALI
jgi:hypothetical protein